MTGLVAIGTEEEGLGVEFGSSLSIQFLQSKCNSDDK